MAKGPAKSLIKQQRERLSSEKAKTEHEIAELKKSDPFADPDHANDNAAIDTDVREQIGHETVQAEIRDLQRRLKDIDRALGKIEKGEYGFCEKCGMLIPLARLELVPEARYCVADEGRLVS